MAVKDVELSKRLQEIADQLRGLSSSIQSLADEMSGRQAAHEVGKGSLEEQLKGELKENLQYVDLSVSQNELKIRPRSFLGTEVFKAVADVSRKHGGRWDGGQRCFIIPLRK